MWKWHTEHGQCSLILREKQPHALVQARGRPAGEQLSGEGPGRAGGRQVDHESAVRAYVRIEFFFRKVTFSRETNLIVNILNPSFHLLFLFHSLILKMVWHTFGF